MGFERYFIQFLLAAAFVYLVSMSLQSANVYGFSIRGASLDSVNVERLHYERATAPAKQLSYR